MRILCGPQFCSVALCGLIFPIASLIYSFKISQELSQKSNINILQCTDIPRNILEKVVPDVNIVLPI